MKKEKVLCVSMDKSVLETCRSITPKHVRIEIAVSPEQGLTTLEGSGPYAALVADFDMVGMDGLEFLGRAWSLSPDTIRVLLTGTKGIMDAVNALNEDVIFRFLPKPCTVARLTWAIEAAIAQYRLLTSERQLLEQTLAGSVKVLTDILSLVNPEAFSRATRIKRYVRHMATQLDLPNKWRYELAAMLSQIGCVTLLPQTMAKVYAGQPLTEDEQRMFAEHPNVSASLLANIPRLETISQMIRGQLNPGANLKASKKRELDEPVLLGAQMLQLALTFDRHLVRGTSIEAAIEQINNDPTEHPSLLVDALENITINRKGMRVKTVTVSELTTDMILDEDVATDNGVLLAARGQDATAPLIERLRNFAQWEGVKEPFRVIIV